MVLSAAPFSVHMRAWTVAESQLADFKKEVVEQPYSVESLHIDGGAIFTHFVANVGSHGKGNATSVDIFTQKILLFLKVFAGIVCFLLAKLSKGFQDPSFLFLLVIDCQSRVETRKISQTTLSRLVKTSA